MKPNNVFEIQAEMDKAGRWMHLKSPFEPGGKWSCGFTPHGTSGWNGVPDFEGFGLTPQIAAEEAYTKFLSSKP